MLVTVTGCTDLERRLASLDFSKKGSGKSAGGSSFLFAVLSCARSRPLYRRRPRRPSGKSNNATCRFRLIYSRYPLEGPSTCKARVVICSHLERIGLRSPRSRKSLSRRASSTPSPLPSSSSLPSSPPPSPFSSPSCPLCFRFGTLHPPSTQLLPPGSTFRSLAEKSVPRFNRAIFHRYAPFIPYFCKQRWCRYRWKWIESRTD